MRGGASAKLWVVLGLLALSVQCAGAKRPFAGSILQSRCVAAGACNAMHNHVANHAPVRHLHCTRE